MGQQKYDNGVAQLISISPDCGLDERTTNTPFCRDVYTTSLFFFLIESDQGPFFPHLLLLFCMLHVHSDTFYGLKLAHSALNAQTKP